MDLGSLNEERKDRNVSIKFSMILYELGLMTFDEIHFLSIYWTKRKRHGRRARNKANK